MATAGAVAHGLSGVIAAGDARAVGPSAAFGASAGIAAGAGTAAGRTVALGAGTSRHDAAAWAISASRARGSYEAPLDDTVLAYDGKFFIGPILDARAQTAPLLDGRMAIDPN